MHRELKKYGSRKFIICAASVLLASVGLYLDQLESKDYALIIGIAIGAYTAANFGAAKLHSFRASTDTTGSA